MSKILYIDGIRLHRALVAGIQRVISREDHLNKINVFPVPDCDTGTNLAFTFEAILSGTKSQVHSNLGQMLSVVAESALDGARGNAGVLFAQYLRGLSESGSKLDKMDTRQFSEVIQTGVEYAYGAFLEPREGTILTVITDFSNQLKHSVKEGLDDFQELIRIGLNRARESLANTPNLLPVLKRAGVVDAGGQGFVDLIEGIYNFIDGGSIREFWTSAEMQARQKITNAHEPAFDTLYQFCTECMIIGKDINRKELQEKLKPLGDSMVLAGSKERAKVHIHSNNPGAVFSICETFGNVSGQKADDMKHQHETAFQKKRAIAIVTDSVADFPENEDLDIHVVPVRFNFGKKGYIDKVSLTSSEFYEELQSNPEHPKTSQPTPGDFSRTYHFLYSHYQSIISIHLPELLSGTLQSAHQAVRQSNVPAVSVLDSHTLSVAQGLLVMNAAEAVKAGKSHDDIVKLIEKNKPRTKLYAAIADLSYAVKGGRIPKAMKVVANIFRLVPVLSTNDEGKLIPIGVLFGKGNLGKKITNFILKRTEKTGKYRVSVGHSNCLEKGRNTLQMLKENLPGLQENYLLDIGGGLGVHVGPGSVAVAIQEIEEKSEEKSVV